MEIIKECQIPANFTGILESNFGKFWYKNGEWHREDGPALTHKNGDEIFYINGFLIYASYYGPFDLENCIILSKEQHPEYPTCQLLKYVNEHGIKEQIIIPGMEKWFME